LGNGTSAVIGVELGAYSIILPGDATWATMMFIDNTVRRDGKPPADCVALGVLH
jgi:hypothetical protein